MHNNLPLKETTLALNKQFHLCPDGTMPDKLPTFSYDELKNLLAQKLTQLANQEFNRFINLLYRIDLDEHRVKETLATRPYAEAMSALAEMVIQRQMQKVFTRQKYSTPQDDLQSEL
ncbi:MAG: hypothetical protein KatS3mg031_2196 [Chitinophagales bacterium]|nr:MAG: hypothetical protein KatS3mg031_2196 [Chitinophagales bacterium]